MGRPAADVLLLQPFVLTKCETISQTMCESVYMSCLEPTGHHLHRCQPGVTRGVLEGSQSGGLVYGGERRCESRQQVIVVLPSSTE